MGPIAQDVAILTTAAAADLASTAYALRNCSSCGEANPLMRRPAVSVLAHAGAVATTAAACAHLRKTGHRRGAKVLRWVVVAVWTGIAVNNVLVGR